MLTFSRLRLLLPLVFCLFMAGVGSAQEISTMRIFTEPSGVRYSVDGQIYYAPSVFAWPKGSKHVVSIDSPVVNREGLGPCVEAGDSIVQYDEFCTKRFTFGGWETNVGTAGSPGASVHVITADPAITFVKGTFTAEYRVWVAMYERSDVGASTACSESNYLGTRPTGAGPGLVFVGGKCIPFATALWLPPGEYSLSAVPYDGYAFRGWSTDGGVNSSYVTVMKIGGPATIHPMFEPAKRVRLFTSPPELELRVDRSRVPSSHPDYPSNRRPVPGFYDWLRYSVHVLGATSPQTDLDGKTWVFDSWSNGGGQDMVYNAGDDVNIMEVLTAKFVRGIASTVITAPIGLKVKVNGRDNFPVNTYTWKVGEKFSVSAPLEQLDSTGRKYTFKRWSNGGPASQDVVADESQLSSGIRLIAEYEALPQVVLRSSYTGAKLRVDGVDCASPCKVDRPMGSTVRVSVPVHVNVSELSRYEFTGWNDGESADRTLTFDRDSLTLQANYRAANRLIAISDPADGAVFKMSPESEDGFFPTGSSVSVLVEPKPGFRFRRWDGDLSGTFRSGSLDMSLSRIVRASLEKIPYVDPAGIRNAAGETPVAGVAPGSIMSIYGASLANASQATSGSTLQQMLAGVVVMVQDRILPLVYVSPEQINAQVPGDLVPGRYPLIVRPQGLLEVKSEFEVVRNAPGLFSVFSDGVFNAVALHEDGTAVTAASPARRNEIVTLMGTGFGPYDRRVIDGFPVPANPLTNLVDPVEVHIGGRKIVPVWTGAHTGMAGIAATRLRMEDIPSGPHELKVIVNGAESNTVVLPVE